MSQIDSSKRLCYWGGLTSGNNESAGKKKSVKFTRVGVYLKPMLVQIAHAAFKNENESSMSKSLNAEERNVLLSPLPR